MLGGAGGVARAEGVGGDGASGLRTTHHSPRDLGRPAISSGKQKRCPTST